MNLKLLPYDTVEEFLDVLHLGESRDEQPVTVIPAERTP
jgi:hypothetical protein